jgi:hypothetical protein
LCLFVHGPTYCDCRARRKIGANCRLSLDSNGNSDIPGFQCFYDAQKPQPPRAGRTSQVLDFLVARASLPIDLLPAHAAHESLLPIENGRAECMQSTLGNYRGTILHKKFIATFRRDFIKNWTRRTALPDPNIA